MKRASINTFKIALLNEEQCMAGLIGVDVCVAERHKTLIPLLITFY